MARVSSPYRYIKEPYESYRVERRSDGEVIGWVNKAFGLGWKAFDLGWMTHRFEDGDDDGQIVATREEAAQVLDQLRAEEESHGASE